MLQSITSAALPFLFCSPLEGPVQRWAALQVWQQARLPQRWGALALSGPQPGCCRGASEAATPLPAPPGWFPKQAVHTRPVN